MQNQYRTGTPPPETGVSSSSRLQSGFDLAIEILTASIDLSEKDCRAVYLKYAGELEQYRRGEISRAELHPQSKFMLSVLPEIELAHEKFPEWKALRESCSVHGSPAVPAKYHLLEELHAIENVINAANELDSRIRAPLTPHLVAYSKQVIQLGFILVPVMVTVAAAGFGVGGALVVWGVATLSASLLTDTALGDLYRVARTRWEFRNRLVDELEQKGWNTRCPAFLLPGMPPSLDENLATLVPPGDEPETQPETQAELLARIRAEAILDRDSDEWALKRYAECREELRAFSVAQKTEEDLSDDARSFLELRPGHRVRREAALNIRVGMQQVVENDGLSIADRIRLCLSVGRSMFQEMREATREFMFNATPDLQAATVTLGAGLSLAAGVAVFSLGMACNPNVPAAASNAFFAGVGVFALTLGVLWPQQFGLEEKSSFLKKMRPVYRERLRKQEEDLLALIAE